MDLLQILEGVAVIFVYWIAIGRQPNRM